MNDGKLEWQCSHCMKIYTTEQFMALPVVAAIKGKSEYGNVMVCECGQPFHKNKWHMVDTKHFFPDIFRFLFYPSIRVSTIHLELNHFGYWYETMVFADKKLLSRPLEIEGGSMRWESKKKAIKGHKKILRKLEDGLWRIEKKDDKKTLVIR